MISGDTAAAMPGQTWTKGKFWLAVAFLLALQVLLICLTGERSARVVAESPKVAVFEALAEPLSQGEMGKAFFVSDPVVFTCATPRGFSGAAWLELRPASYAPAEELEPPSVLALDARRTGKSWPEEIAQVPFHLAEQKALELTPVPVVTSPPTIRTQSVFHVEGPLAGLQLGTSATLGAWPAAQLLSNTVVEIGVDRAGQVVFHRIAAGCGLAEADAEALSVARKLRFAPAGNAAAAITWSKVVFEWRTLELPAK